MPQRRDHGLVRRLACRRQIHLGGVDVDDADLRVRRLAEETAPGGEQQERNGEARGGSPLGHPRTAASTSRALFGITLVKTSWPDSVTSTSSSMRTPMPRHLGSTVSSSASK